MISEFGRALKVFYLNHHLFYKSELVVANICVSISIAVNCYCDFSSNLDLKF